MRESQAIESITKLIDDGANIIAYDPAVMDEARPLLPKAVRYASSAQKCLSGVDGAVVVTEWNEFCALTPQLLVEKMRGKVLIDLRNVYDPEQMTLIELNYQSIGRSIQVGIRLLNKYWLAKYCQRKRFYPSLVELQIV